MDRKIVIPTAALVLLAGILIVVWLCMKNGETDDPTAEIRLNGEVVKTVPLSEDCEFTVDCGGGFNTVRVKNGAVSVVAADCPDKVCVRTGEISGGGVPIVCLPHRLEIVVINGERGVDAAT